MDEDLTKFQTEILRILVEKGELYGLAIKRNLETYYGTEVNHGRLYPNLDNLVEQGYVSKSARDKRTNNYAPTEDAYDVVEHVGNRFRDAANEYYER